MTATATPLYLVAELTVHDPEKLLQYAGQVQPVLERFGGRIVATFPPSPDAIEGDWQPQVLVIQRWRSPEDFRAFWSSPDYAPLRELRQAASASRIVTLVGVPEPDAVSPTNVHDHAAGDLEAIRRTVADAQRYQSDLEPMLGLHTEDTIIVNIAGRRVIDRDAFRHAMQQALASPLADVTTTVDIDDIRFVAAKVAIVSCTKHVHHSRDTADGGIEALPSVGALTYVVVKGQDGWKIALAQTTPTRG